MKVILTKDVRKIGKRNEIKEINDGYARNFLIPQGLAVEATDRKIAEVQRTTMVTELEKNVQADLLKKNLEQLANITITLKEKGNASGHLFSSIHKKEIIEALHKQAHIDINEEYLIIEKPIKELGESIIQVQVNGMKGQFKLVVENQ